MSTDGQEVKAVAAALGFRAKAELAPICGVKRNTPYEWGPKIPAKHWPAIFAYARENGRTLPQSFLRKAGVISADDVADMQQPDEAA